MKPIIEYISEEKNQQTQFTKVLGRLVVDVIESIINLLKSSNNVVKFDEPIEIVFPEDYQNPQLVHSVTCYDDKYTLGLGISRKTNNVDIIKIAGIDALDTITVEDLLMLLEKIKKLV